MSITVNNRIIAVIKAVKIGFCRAEYSLILKEHSLNKSRPGIGSYPKDVEFCIIICRFLILALMYAIGSFYRSVYWACIFCHPRNVRNS